MKRFFATILVLCAMASASFGHAQPLPEMSVDLHSHIFMKPGLGWLFSSSFGEPLAADSWDDRLSSKVNAETLDASGIGIVVVALFAHPVYRMDVRDAIREQIAAVEQFVAKHPTWSLARSPTEADRLLRAGQRVMVLSLEGAGGVLESEEDLREFIDEKGIRIVTPLHLADDRYGGAASMNGFQYLANPIEAADQLLDGHAHHGVETNRQGLTPLGERLAIELVRRGVWLDLTHASDAALDKLVPIAGADGRPLLLTHATLRRDRPHERATSDAMLKAVARSRGLVGLLPSDDAFVVPSTDRTFCPRGCSLEACAKGIPALARAYSKMAAVAGAHRVLLGTDFNGGMKHLSPSCGTGSELDEEAGYFHVGQTDLVWDGLRHVGAPVPKLSTTIATFIDTWKRVTPSNVAARPELPPLPSRDQTEGPGWRLTLGTGLSSTPGSGEPGLVLLVESLVMKDSRLIYPREPTFYFAHARADVTKALDNDGVPYATAQLNAIGVRAAWHDNLTEVGGARLLLRRNTALDQDVNVALRAFGGRLRTMPGVLKWPGEFNFFVELGADLLGDKQISRQVAVSRGFYLAGGDVAAGATLFPGPGFSITLRGWLGADFTFMPTLDVDGVGYQSDVATGGTLSLRVADGMFEPQLRVLRTLDVEAERAQQFDDTQVRGTIAVSF